MEYTSFYLSFVYVYSTFSANKEISMDTKQKVGRIILASTAAYKSYHGLKICQIYEVFTVLSKKSLKALFLDTTRRLTVSQKSAALTTTCSPKQFSRRVLISQS